MYFIQLVFFWLLTKTFAQNSTQQQNITTLDSIGNFIENYIEIGHSSCLEKYNL